MVIAFLEIVVSKNILRQIIPSLPTFFETFLEKQEDFGPRGQVIVDEYLKLTMLQGKGAENFLRREGVRAWCIR